MFTPRGHCRTFMILGLTFSASVAQAQVTLDGTLGPAGPLSGPNYAIPAEVGQQHGGNLFHSFGQFSIQQGESATFSGPNSVNNIIGRVTGGQVSTIDGLLRSTIPGANLYLLNPAGLLFGENARLDVSGSFHASTADYLRLSEGGRFDALTPGNSVLTVAPVEAFGFLGDAPERIDINGSYLHGAEGQTLSLIGGDIALTNVTVYAPAGRLNVAAVGSAGEVIPTDTDLLMQGFGRLGTLTLERDPAVERVTVNMGEPFGEAPLGDLDTSGEGGGAMFIRGGEWISRGGKVFADTYGEWAGRDVDIRIAGGMQFTDGAGLTATTLGADDAGNVNLTVADALTLINGGYIGADTWGAGDAGDVSVTAGNLLVDGMGSGFTTGLFSSAGSGSTGAGGNLNLTVADTLTVRNGGQILAGAFAQGDAGEVSVTAGNLLVDGSPDVFTGIASSAAPGSTGDSGDMTVNVADSLTLQNGGEISASTFGAGRGGNLVVAAGGATTITGGFFDAEQRFVPSGLFASAYSAGHAGNLRVDTDTLTLQSGGRLLANTFGAGDAGEVTVNARNLRADRQGSSEFTGIASSAESGSGSGGNVTLNIADTLTLQGGGDIRSSTFTQGHAGDVAIIAGNVHVDGQGSGYLTGITSQATSSSTGAGGNVYLTVTDALTLINGGQINASTLGAGNAGEVSVTAGNLLVDGMGSELDTGLFSSAGFGSTGAGGNLNLTVVDTLTVRNGGQILTGAFAQGDAGEVTVNVRNLLIDQQGSPEFTGIASSAAPGSTGDSGDMTVNVADSLTLQNGGEISASTFGAGRGGNLVVAAGGATTITGGFFDAEQRFVPSGLFASAYSAGHAGNLRVDTDTLTLQSGGRLLANTFGAGDAGEVTVNARNLRADRQGSSEFTGIASSTESGSGSGGNVTLNIADTLTLQGGGDIRSSTFTQGYAGDIAIIAGNVRVDGQGSGYLTGITSQATSSSTGAGGNVYLTVADALTLINGGQIDASTGGTGRGGDLVVAVGGATTISGGFFHTELGFIPSGLFSSAYSIGDAGNLTVTTPRLTLADGGSIYARSVKTTGGNLLINADHLKLLNGSAISSSVAGDEFSNGGNVTLNSINIVALDGSTVTARANQGQGGDITVNAEVFLHNAPSTSDVLNASSQTLGNDGTVEVNAPNIDISGSLANLNPAYLDVAHHVSPRCFVGDRDERNHFLIHGRGTLPLGPDEAIPAPVSRCLPAEPVALASSTTDIPTERPSPAPVVEPPAAVLGFNNR